ncbi:hypothetical protein CERSUDRAFT_132628 [Gelatoporia subvermispora B]|uniref:Amidohydrolase-related domain-containing protein n=1 Tax=Ceriporiopsis subvermispora (strain B) TaxID=914234 RepID=M2QSE2_CERS8|nr:hypothetical protein CERSUDRAFT_132628 [Gelatoporia subvermispora B]
MATTDLQSHSAQLVIHNVHLASISADDVPQQTYTIICNGNEIATIRPAAVDGEVVSAQRIEQEYSNATILDAGGRGILLPSFCHAHIHLDKCFLLPGGCDHLSTGGFQEALKVTAKAKAGFPTHIDDLYARGKRLVTESIKCGVTIMRAHVEVDQIVHMFCLDAGLRLKEEFKDTCDLQLAVFAQDPLFAGCESEEPGMNYDILCQAAGMSGVSAIGSAPYVEPSIAHAKRNIDLVLELAFREKLHVDFHLDYNLDQGSEPLIWYLVSKLRERIRNNRWHLGARVCVGHATRLTLFSHEEWHKLAQEVGDPMIGTVENCDGQTEDGTLALTLVGLPPSDLYMMGRDMATPPRGTLDAIRLRREHNLRVAMSINNVGNAFTPQGTTDPLALCPLGIAIFQAGTEEDTRILLEAITVVAKGAIQTPSTPEPTNLRLKAGHRADLVLLHENDSLYEAALRPSYSRATIKNGMLVATRMEQSWILETETNHQNLK